MNIFPECILLTQVSAVNSRTQKEKESVVLILTSSEAIAT